MMQREREAAWSIRTPRLLLRAWSPDDAGALKEAIDSSLDHLRAWMPWADDEPTPLDALARRLAGFRSQFESGENSIYAIFDVAGTRVLGGAGLHPRIGAAACEIGYWIRTGETGRGLATEAAGALTRVAFEVRRRRVVEIHCHPGNAASAAVPSKLGYRHEATVDGWTPQADATPRATMFWRMRRSGYAGSAAARMPVTVADRTGVVVRLASPPSVSRAAP